MEYSNCKVCKKQFSYYKKSRKNAKYCSHKCSGEDRRREKATFWRGGRVNNSSGYVWILANDHPNRDTRGYVYEHRLVMEGYLGRYLKKNEIVYHKNGIKNDNRIENLELKVVGQHGPKFTVRCPSCDHEFEIVIKNGKK